jgi:hypothetical protein
LVSVWTERVDVDLGAVISSIRTEARSSLESRDLREQADAVGDPQPRRQA